MSVASSRTDAPRGAEPSAKLAAISAAVILLSPVTFPWYTPVLLAFICFRPRASLLALATAPMFWFLRFVRAPVDSPWHIIQLAEERWRQPWRVPVYAVVFALFLREGIKARRQAGDSASGDA